MRNDTVTLELAGIQVTATIDNAESFPSPHTGRQLERLQVRFAVDGEATNDQIIKALEANQEVTLLQDAGQRVSFKPDKNSWSYTEGIARYRHDLELTEQEDLQPTAVVLGQLEITPYVYEERIEADGDLGIDLKTRLDSSSTPRCRR